MRGFILFFALVAAVFGKPLEEERVEHAGAVFRVVRVEPERARLVWRDVNGRPFRTFERVFEDFSKRGITLRFMMNAGIFEPGGIPSGLHVEDGKEMRPLNLADAPGNFFLKPNGVMAWGSGRGGKTAALICKSEDWRRVAAGQGMSTHWALQSGPLLLLDGTRHPAFRKNSPNKLHRNGVGLDAEGRFVFAMTDRGQEVNLWDFAGLFLTSGCRDALFLDGDISQMAVNPGAAVKGNPFGAILVVVD